MRVGLHDTEAEHFRGKKKFPNYLVMKISAWHKAQGDTVKWIRFLRFSCDHESQIEPILRTCELLAEHGVKPYRVFVYLLVTADLESASRRVEALKRLRGINLYAQAERNESMGIHPSRTQLEFAQRYVYSGCFRHETWQEYIKRKRSDVYDG